MISITLQEVLCYGVDLRCYCIWTNDEGTLPAASCQPRSVICPPQRTDFCNLHDASYEPRRHPSSDARIPTIIRGTRPTPPASGCCQRQVALPQCDASIVYGDESNRTVPARLETQKHRIETASKFCCAAQDLLRCCYSRYISVPSDLFANADFNWPQQSDVWRKTPQKDQPRQAWMSQKQGEPTGLADTPAELASWLTLTLAKSASYDCTGWTPVIDSQVAALSFRSGSPSSLIA